LGISLDKQRTSVVCISHSGQTFPTIQAARVLSAHLPGRVFVMTGSIDTKMSLAVKQQTWKVRSCLHFSLSASLSCHATGPEEPVRLL